MSAWFKCFPERILDSYDKLDSDQRAAAYTLTMLIYQHDGPLTLSEANLAGRCGFALRKYRRIIHELMALGKFYITPAGALSNERADELLEHRRAARDFGSVGGKKRAANATRKRDANRLQEEFIACQKQSGDGKDNTNNDGGQGSLGFGFKYKDRDSSEAKASGAEAPPDDPEKTDREFVWNVGKALLIDAGVDKKSAGSTIGELVKRKGVAETKRIIIAAQAKPLLEAKSYVWKIIHGDARPPMADRPTIALCRLGDFSWDHDWTTHENFVLEGERRVPLGRDLTAAEQAVVDRAVARNLDNRRAA